MHQNAEGNKRHKHAKITPVSWPSQDRIATINHSGSSRFFDIHTDTRHIKHTLTHISVWSTSHKWITLAGKTKITSSLDKNWFFKELFYKNNSVATWLHNKITHAFVFFQQSFGEIEADAISVGKNVQRLTSLRMHCDWFWCNAAHLKNSVRQFWWQALEAWRHSCS